MGFIKDNYIYNAISAFSAKRCLFLFDYDLTIARIPVDWKIVRLAFRKYIQKNLPDIVFKEGLRLDEMERLALDKHPNKFDLIYAYRKKIESQLQVKHDAVLDTVNFLKSKTNAKFYVVSNNFHATIIKGLNQLGLLSQFSKIVGIDDSRKPKPSTRSLSLLGLSNEMIHKKSIFIGDSDNTDGALCKKAKIPFINIAKKTIQIY